MATMIRPTSSDLSNMSRTAQRKQRLLEIETEQRIEEAEALKMTEEQREILFRSFKSVKVEFSDLDGHTWSDSRQRVTSSCPQPSSVSSPLNHAFVILTKADLASFKPEDTIRASASRSQPRYFIQPLSSPNLSLSSGMVKSSNTKYCSRDGMRPHSPAKGDFHFNTLEYNSDRDRYADSNREGVRDKLSQRHTSRMRIHRPSGPRSECVLPILSATLARAPSYAAPTSNLPISPALLDPERVFPPPSDISISKDCCPS